MTAEERKAVRDLTLTASALCGILIGATGTEWQAQIDAFRQARARSYDALYNADTYEGKRPNG